MSEEAFALSPIAARPSLPSEADYDAIREAFMETSRGRWFLSEYAKRNRNADTRMVLDAVERIEQSIAAQKPSSASGLMEALGPISALIGDTRNAVAKALPDPLDVLAPAREGAKVTREVASALRECGADVRICDLLDSQVDAIESAHQQMVMSAAREVVLAAFDRLLQDVIDLTSAPNSAAPRPSCAEATPPSETAPPPSAAAANTPPVSTAEVEPQARHVEPPPAPTPAPAFDAAAESDLATEPETDDDALFDEPAAIEVPAAIEAPAVTEELEAQAPLDEPAAPTLEQIIADEAMSDAAFAHDIAVLDLVAQEMAAPDDDDLSDLEFADPAPVDHAEQAVAEPAQPAAEPAPSVRAPVQAVVAEPVVVPPAAVPPQGQPQMQMQAAAPASVGAAVLAHGAVRKPAASSDPFAALRRMTQAEKLAFFS